MTRFLMCLLWFASLMPGATFSFDLLPGSTLSGTAGSTIGWGYTLTNTSADQWLVPTNLNSGTFVSATPNVLFDFPILAPGATVTQAYDPVQGKGMMELIVDASLATTVVNTGTFVLDAEWWSGDPFAGGAYVADADSAMQSYRAELSPAAAVPEPSTVVLGVLGGGLLGLAGWSRRRHLRR